MRSPFSLLAVGVLAAAVSAEAESLLPPGATTVFDSIGQNPGWADGHWGRTSSMDGYGHEDVVQHVPGTSGGHAVNCAFLLVNLGPDTDPSQTGLAIFARIGGPWNDPPVFSAFVSSMSGFTDTGMRSPGGTAWWAGFIQFLTVSIPPNTDAWLGYKGIMATINTSDWLDIPESPFSQSQLGCGPGALWDHDYGTQAYLNQGMHLYDGVEGVVWGYLPVPGDLNGDNVIDFDDFVLFAGCLAGANHPPACGDPTAARADMNDDGDVDLADFAEFQRLFGGTP